MAQRKWISWAGSLAVVVALAGAAFAFRPQPIKKHPGGTHVFRAVEAERGLGLGCQTFAQITGQAVPAEGTMVCCSDCGQVDPCAGGGSGSIAQYVGGRWTCSGGGAAAGVFNVTDFGAVCDGTTDDTLAIQAAIDTAVGHCTIAVATSCIQDDDCPAAETCVKTQGIVQLPAATCKVGGAKHCSYSTGTTCTVDTDCPKHCASPDDPDICTVGGDCPGASCVDYETCTTAIVTKAGVTFQGVRGFADGAGGSILKGTQGTGDAVVSLHQRLRDLDVFISPFTIKDLSIRNGDFLIDSLDGNTFVTLEDLSLSGSVGAQLHLQGCNEEWYVRNVQMSGCNPCIGIEDVIIPGSTCANTLIDKSSFENVRFAGGVTAINIDVDNSNTVNWTNTIFNFLSQDPVVATGAITNWVWTNTNSEGTGFFSTEDTYAKGDMTASSAQLDNLGSCSEDATKNCNVDGDCTGTCQEPSGQCSTATSTSCRVDSECPATQTCTAAFAVGDVITVRGAGVAGKDLTGTVLSLCGTGPRTCVTLDTTATISITGLEATDALYSTIKLTDTHAGGTAPSSWTFVGGAYGATAINGSVRYAVDISRGAAMRFYGTSVSRPVYDPNQSAVIVGGATNVRQPASLAVGQSTFQTVVIPGAVGATNSETPRTFIPSPPGKDIVLGLRDSLGSGTGTYGKVTACQFNPNRNCTWESRATSPLLNDIGSTWIRGPLIYNGSSFANLGTPGNGMTIYCNDCERTDPCRAGGGGAMAKRLNGRWACDGGGSSAGVFNVTDFGAICDGATDDTTAILATIAAAPDGSTIMFPGTGLCLTKELAFSNRNGLRFTSEAGKGGLKRETTDNFSKMLNCTTCSDLEVDHMQFDFNAIVKNGDGIRCTTGCSRVRIHDNRLFDSNQQVASGFDRFGIDVNNSTDIWITDNYIFGVDTEVDDCQHVRITGNYFEDTHEAGSIAVGAVGSNKTAEDYVIENNVFKNPLKRALFIATDQVGQTANVWRRFSIRNNTFYVNAHTNVTGVVKFGNVSTGSTDTNTFEEIVFTDNILVLDAGLGTVPDDVVLFLSGTANTTCNHCDFSRNVVRNENATAWVFDLRYLENSLVSRNRIEGAALRGITLSGGIDSNTITDNVVTVTTTAFQLATSLGNNTVFGNVILGAPTTDWTLTGLQASDRIYRDRTGSVFADLGTPVDGVMTYCSDCTRTDPCAGSGTGAIAKRLAGAWVCN